MRERIQMMTDIIALSSAFEDSPGKHALWCALLALTTTLKSFADKASAVGFISDKLGLFKCVHGMIVYTSKEGYWVTVNIIIPAKMAETGQLLGMFTKVFCNSCFVVDWASVRTQVDVDEEHDIFPRHFLADAKALQMVQLADDHLCMGSRTLPVRRIDVVDIRHFRPITRSFDGDDDEEVFWGRVDGVLVALTNPRNRRKYDALSFGARATHSSEHVTDAKVRLVVDAFDGDMATDEQQARVLRVLEFAWVPVQIRRHLAILLCTRSTLDDVKVSVVARSLAPIADADTEFAYTICATHRVMTEGMMTVDNMLCFFRQISSEARRSAAWRSFMRHSVFLRETVLRLPPVFVKRAVAMPYVCDICCQALRQRVGVWSHEDTERVRILCEMGAAPVDLKESLDVLLRQWDDAFGCCYERTAPERAVTRVPPPATVSSRTVHASLPAPTKDLDRPSVVSRATSHVELSDRIARQMGIDATLIGSGIFFDGHDIDLVVRVDTACSLEEAYEHVARKTGWTLQGVADGARTALLRGVVDGVPVDAQVWRGREGATPAEDLTASALALTRCLRANRGDFARAVRVMHTWADAADVKSHLRCTLPGVAVTCIAIAFASRRDCASDDVALLRSLLTDLSLALETTMVPIIDLDDGCLNAHQPGERVVCALQVTAKGQVLNTRMTRATTRALQLSLRDARDSADADLLRIDYYRARRDRRTVFCGACRPSNDDANARYLKQIACKLDANELIAALAFVQAGDTLAVYVELDTCAEPRHGFGALPRIVEVGDRVVEVETDTAMHRGRRVLLPRIVAHQGIDWQSSTRPGVPLRLRPDVVVPNAPYLLVDVRRAFGPMWTWV